VAVVVSVTVSATTVQLRTIIQLHYSYWYDETSNMVEYSRVPRSAAAWLTP